MPDVTEKNLPLRSAQMGTGELLTPLIAQRSTVSLSVGAVPLTSRLVSLTACASPLGSNDKVRFGIASSRSRNQAVASMGAFNEA